MRYFETLVYVISAAQTVTFLNTRIVKIDRVKTSVDVQQQTAHLLRKKKTGNEHVRPNKATAVAFQMKRRITGDFEKMIPAYKNLKTGKQKICLSGGGNLDDNILTRFRREKSRAVY